MRSQGYTGSEATFYRWLAGLKADLKEPAAACRFETDPGEQAQFDWSPYTVRVGEQLTRLTIYSLVLAYSRRAHWFPSLSEKQEAVFEGLEEGWRHFGGACRFLVVDNARAFVTSRRGSEVVWNANFLRLCGHYSVQPIASTPGHPQGKGKVENPFRWLEGRFLQGREWRDLDHLQAELAEHEAAWEERIHGTTKVPPRQRFEAEAPCLLPLPATPFLQRVETFRHVSRDCLLSYEGVHYSVPWPYAGKSVVVRSSQGRLLVIFSTSGKEIARHVVRPRGSPPVFDARHYEGLRRRHGATLAVLVPRFHERYTAQSENAKRFLERLLANHHAHPDRALADALGLLTAVPDAVAMAAIGTAVEYNLCTLRFLEEQLRRALQHSAGTTPDLPSAGPLGQRPCRNWTSSARCKAMRAPWEPPEKGERKLAWPPP